MRECAVVAALDGLTIMFDIFRISGTMFSKIQRAVAKKTVEFFNPLVAWVIFTLFIGKISRTVFHCCFSLNKLMWLYHRFFMMSVLTIENNWQKPKHLFAFSAILCYHSIRKRKYVWEENIWHTERLPKSNHKF